MNLEETSRAAKDSVPGINIKEMEKSKNKLSDWGTPAKEKQKE